MPLLSHGALATWALPFYLRRIRFSSVPGVLRMMDGVAFAWSLLQDGIATVVGGITKRDIVALVISFAVSAVIIESIERTQSRVRNLINKYANRFRRHGLKNPAVWYALSLGSVLLIAAALLILVHDLTELMIWAIGLIAAIALVVFTALGWRARGPSWFEEPRPSIRRFAIFYEPAAAAVTPFVVHKLPDIAVRLTPVFAAIQELLLGYMV
jgi:hypothetical protein